MSVTLQAGVPLNFSLTTQQTPLCEAVLHGHVGITEQMLDNGADPNLGWHSDQKCNV